MHLYYIYIVLCRTQRYESSSDSLPIIPPTFWKYHFFIEFFFFSTIGFCPLAVAKESLFRDLLPKNPGAFLTVWMPVFSARLHGCSTVQGDLVFSAGFCIDRGLLVQDWFQNWRMDTEATTAASLEKTIGISRSEHVGVSMWQEGLFCDGFSATGTKSQARREAGRDVRRSRAVLTRQ